MAINRQKLKLLYLMRMLEEETDAERGLTMAQIIGKLEALGISAERKSIYRDIEALREFGVDVRTYQRAPVEYAVEHRAFAFAELQLLVDAVQSSRFLTQRKSDALVEGVKDGTVDAIVTDHAPHNDFEKNAEFELAPFGMIGLETALSLVITNLVAPGVISWERAVELMAVRPRKILRVERVALEPGAAADLTVIDPEAAWTVDAADFQSKAVNSGFLGAELTGRATDVYVGGYATMEDGAIVE